MSTRRSASLGLLCCILFLSNTPASAAPASSCLNADLNSIADDFLARRCAERLRLFFLVLQA